MNQSHEGSPRQADGMKRNKHEKRDPRVCDPSNAHAQPLNRTRPTLKMFLFRLTMLTLLYENEKGQSVGDFCKKINSERGKMNSII